MRMFRLFEWVWDRTRRVVGTLWSGLISFGMMHAVGDPDTFWYLAYGEWLEGLPPGYPQWFDGPPPGHPERLTGKPLTPLERRLVRELREAGADDVRRARDRRS